MRNLRPADRLASEPRRRFQEEVMKRQAKRLRREILVATFWTYIPQSIPGFLNCRHVNFGLGGIDPHGNKHVRVLSQSPRFLSFRPRRPIRPIRPIRPFRPIRLFNPPSTTQNQSHKRILEICILIPFHLAADVQQVVDAAGRPHLQALGDPLDSHRPLRPQPCDSLPQCPQRFLTEFRWFIFGHI